MDRRVAAAASAEVASVLVVDDCETSLLFQEYALQGLCRVVKARDGLEALRLVEGQRIDLVLLDLGLPGVDGLEVLRRMRARDPSGDTPVVVVSTQGAIETRELARRSGCSEYLAKPVSFGELVRVVRRHLRR